MKRRAEQGSMQLQGEVQELLLEEMLREHFPYDVISEVGKGVEGADCIQTVRNHIGTDDLHESPDPNWNLAHVWFEEGQHWSRFFTLLRTFLQQQPDFDELEIQVLDALHRNAVRDGSDPKAEEIFRGKTFQVIHEPLLATLRCDFSESDWDMKRLDVTLAKLCRHAEGIQRDA